MIRLAILISGSGSTLNAILNARKKIPNIEIVVVVSSRQDAPGLTFAKKHNVPSFVVTSKDSSFSDKLLHIFSKHHIDVISQNGWLPLTPKKVITKFRGRIINQHPGPLDPGREMDFGGYGMYGRRVTASRIAFSRMTKNNNWTEVTVHHVTEKFDKGSIIRIEKLVFNEANNSLFDATRKLSQNLLPVEHANVIQVLQDYGKTKSFSVFIRKNRLVQKNEKILLEKAKQMAIELFPNG